jgi:hypothetical protein
MPTSPPLCSRVGEVEVMGRLVAGRALAAPGSVDAGGVPQVGRAPRLVVGRPQADPVAETPGDHVGVLRERLRRAPHEPAALLLQRLRQVPVEQRRAGGQAALEQAVDQPVVVVQAAFLHPAPPLGQDPRPGHREAVELHAQPLHQVEVLLEAVVAVAGGRTVRPVSHGARPGGEDVPDRRPSAVLVGGALDLVGGGRGAEGEVPGRGDSSRHGVEPSPPTRPGRVA